MATTKEIKQWLSAVATARNAVNRAIVNPVAEDLDTDYELRRADDMLVEVFDKGLEAHGQAVLRDYLEASKAAESVA